MKPIVKKSMLHICFLLALSVFGIGGVAGAGVEQQSSPSSAVALTSMPATSVNLSPGQSYTLSNCSFENLTYGTVALKISGSSNNTVTISNCLFKNVGWAIKLYKVDNVIITGSRFENVGTAIRSLASKNHSIQYNEFEKIGVHDTCYSYEGGGWCAANAVGLVHAVTGGSVNISNNRIDNSGIVTGAKNYSEDAISLYFSTAASGQGVINNNWIRGHATSGSGSAGGIVFDQLSDNFSASNNTMVNWGQYGFGTARSNNIVFDGNRSFSSWQHDAGLGPHPYRTGWSNAVGVVASDYTESGGAFCGANVVFRNNIAVAEAAAKPGLNAYAGYDSNFWSPCPDGTITLTNNNFGWNFSTKTYIAGPVAKPTGFGTGILPTNMFTNLTTEYFSCRQYGACATTGGTTHTINATAYQVTNGAPANQDVTKLHAVDSQSISMSATWNAAQGTNTYYGYYTFALPAGVTTADITKIELEVNATGTTTSAVRWFVEKADWSWGPELINASQLVDGYKKVTVPLSASALVRNNAIRVPVMIWGSTAVPNVDMMRLILTTANAIVSPPPPSPSATHVVRPTAYQVIHGSPTIQDVTKLHAADNQSIKMAGTWSSTAKTKIYYGYYTFPLPVGVTTGAISKIELEVRATGTTAPAVKWFVEKADWGWSPELINASQLVSGYRKVTIPLSASDLVRNNAIRVPVMIWGSTAAPNVDMMRLILATD